MKAIVNAAEVLKPTTDPAWTIEDDLCDPLREGSREARFNVSNGFLAVRCATALDPDARIVRPPRTYVAGLFDTIGGSDTISGLVGSPDWLELRIELNGETLEYTSSENTRHRVVLDMQRGVALTEWWPQNAAGLAVRVRTLHLVSLHSRALGLQLVEVRVEDGEAAVTIEASVGQQGLTLVPEVIDGTSGVWRTKQSGKRLGIAVASSLTIDGRAPDADPAAELSQTWHSANRQEQTLLFERIVAIARADTLTADVAGDARRDLDAAVHGGWERIVAEHEASWTSRWRASDVAVDAAPNVQKALRFAVYQLNGAPDPGNERVSIGARALTGEDYHGHVFWDTEIYLVPFYVMTWPEAARALLMYRFHTLGEARAKAKRMGWRGALYAWESADTGVETTPAQVVGKDGKIIDVLSGTQEQHISADVAYAVWQYWQATRDEGYMLEAGAEILLETARFWASRATLESDGKRHIRGVIGPDEYHEHIDDSAFTNVMARWNLRRGLDVAGLLAERWPERWTELRARLDLNDAELDHWRDVAKTIVTGLDEKTGLFEEFAGFFGLEYIDLSDYADRMMPMDVVLGRDRIQRSQVVKQADIVALLALLPEEFAGDSGAANFAYYEPRCDHGSSLSRGLHALVAARLGDLDMAERYFEGTAAIDLSDSRPPVGGGIHIAAQGGVWLATVFGFSGLSLRDDGLAIDPNVPIGWGRLSYPIQWRGRKLQIEVDPVAQLATATLEEGEPMRIFVRGQAYDLDQTSTLRVNIAEAQTASRV